MPPADTHPSPAVLTRLAAALEIAAEAADLTRGYFGRATLDIRTKADGSAVTEADTECERLIRRRIAEAFPRDGVLGEELDDTPAESGFRWIVDPIDGTFSFARGIPLYTTLLAVEEATTAGPPRVLLGVISAPQLGERVHAALGGGAFHTGSDGRETPARVSGKATLGAAAVSTTSLDYADHGDQRARLIEALNAARHSRGFPDAYAAILLATGRIDAVVECNFKRWDIAPLRPIVVEAGGKLSDWHGEEDIRRPTLLASNGLIHAELVSLLGS